MQKRIYPNAMHAVLFLLYLSVNSLFIAKYAGRITAYYPLIILAYSIILTVLYLFCITKKQESGHKATSASLRWVYYALVLSALATAFVLYHLIDPQKLHIDRWIALNEFTQNLFNGRYPYSELSYGGGFASPFPVWQCLHIPFALLGNVNYAMLVSLILLSGFLRYYFGNYASALVYLLLLFASPAFWYEIAGRSDLLYNFLICMMVVAWMQKNETKLHERLVAIAVVCGLFLSTRITTAIPFFILLFPAFIRLKTDKKLTFVAVIVLTFCITFVPLLWWGDYLFSYRYNPFVLQTRQGSSWCMLPVALLFVFAALKWRNGTHYFSVVALAFTAMVVVSIGEKMIRQHFENGLFSPAFDITYFSMALPFALMALASYKVQLNTTITTSKP